MLELKDVSKRFGNNILFDGVNLKIKKGELIHLQGSNGSGKSTLFKMICDIQKTTSGTILLKDNTNIGAIIGTPGFIENETILYNLKYLYNLKSSFDEEKVKLLCNEFNLDLYSKEKLKNYSVGMRQKTAIIQAIMEDQDLILLDEPTSGLDKESTKVFYEIIKKLNKEKKTIIIASHESEDALKFDRVLKIENHKIVE